MPESDSSQPGEAAEPDVLELRGVSKRFGGVLAADEVSLRVRPNEVVGLVGSNGARKSTVMRVVSGVHAPDSGRVLLSGQGVSLHGPRDARSWGIETVPQDLALARHLSVAANIVLGREITRGLGPLRVLNKKAMARRAAELVEGFGIHIPNLQVRVHDLSGGQQQGVAIGSNEAAARIAGVRTRRMLLVAYVNSAQPSDHMNLELNAIAAAVIGGASLFGGEGAVWSSMIGALLISVLDNGTELLGISTSIHTILLGFVVIIAVVVDNVRRRSRVAVSGSGMRCVNRNPGKY